MSKLSEDLGGDNELITSTTTPPISAENAWKFGIRKEYAKVERDVWTTSRLASVRILRRILFAVKHTVSSGSATAFAKSLPNSVNSFRRPRRCTRSVRGRHHGQIGRGFPRHRPH